MRQERRTRLSLRVKTLSDDASASERFWYVKISLLSSKQWYSWFMFRSNFIRVCTAIGGFSCKFCVNHIVRLDSQS